MSNYIDNLTQNERYHLINRKTKLTNMTDTTDVKRDGKEPFKQEILDIHIEYINLKKGSRLNLLKFISDIRDMQVSQYPYFYIKFHVNIKK